MKQEFEIMEKHKYLKTYWEGKENRFIRLWIYAQRGLTEINEFKYFILLFVGLVGLLYAALPLMLVVVIGLIGIPSGLIFLIVLGRWQLRKAAKVEQWIQTEYGSVLRYNSYNLQVRTLEVLEKILKKLNNK